MRASEIKEGRRYRARVFDRVTLVEVNEHWRQVLWNGDVYTGWNVTELGTGRKTRITDAQRFLEPAEEPACGCEFRGSGLHQTGCRYGNPLTEGRQTPLEIILRASIDALLKEMKLEELLRIRVESPNVQLQEFCHKELFRRGVTQEWYRG